MNLFLQSLLLLLLSNPLADQAIFHEFHLSKSLVEYNASEKAIQVSMHIFLDDLEEALRKQGKDQLHICTTKESAEAEAHLEAYIRDHFKMIVNGKAVEFNFLGKEPSEDYQAAWCYIEVEGVETLKDIEIRNDLLMEIFDDQKNVVQLIGPNKKRGVLLLQKGRTKEKVSF